MADNIVGGLFGVDPSVLQRQQQMNTEAQAYRYASLDPMQQAKYSQFAGSAQLARGAGGLLGMEDPELVKATKIKQAASQVDLSTSEGLLQLSKAIQSFAPQEAAMAAAEADKRGLTQAQTAKALREQRTPTSGLGKLITERDQLLADGVPANDPRVLAYTKAISAEGEGKGTKVSVDLGGIATLFAKKEAEASAKDVTERISKAQQALGSNSKVSRDIAEIEKILPNSFQGQFANFNKTASKTLSALGVPVSEKASNTETLTALTNNLVIPAVKQLPGSLAAKELAFLQETKPTALQEPATVKRLIGMLKDDIAVNRAVVKRADAYTKQDKLGSLRGFNLELQQDELYGNVRKYNDLKAKVQAKQPITKEEAEFAKSVEQELGL